MSYFKVIVNQFGEPDLIGISGEKTLPEPKSNELRLRMLASSVSFTDTLIRRKRYPISIRPPFVPGYEVIGEVDAIGNEVSQFKIGDRVAALTVIGGNAEVLCLEADKVVPVPKDIEPVDALCMVLSYMTAYQMLHRVAEVKQGQTVLVHAAAGAVGTALAQLGAVAGLKMFGTASKPKHALLQEAGVYPIDYRNEDFSHVIRSQQPEGLDAVFDPLGGDVSSRSFDLLKKQGILVGFGSLHQAQGKMALVGLEILRLYLWNILPNGKRAVFYSISDWYKQKLAWCREDIHRLFDLLRAGKIKPLIAAAMPLTDAAKAHDLVERTRPVGKVILLPTT